MGANMKPLLIATALAAMSAAAAKAENVADFYKGRTVNIIVGFGPGGGYDLYGRVLGRHLGRHIPGHPTIVAANMPGASGMQSAAYLFQLAPKDGSVLGMFNQSMAQRQVLEPDLIRFDAGKFNWLGAMATSTTVFVTWYTSGVRTLADARQNPIRPDYRPKYFALRSVKSFHFSGRSSSAKIALTGHTGTHAPQSMHSTGSMYNISSFPWASSSFLG